MKRFINTMTDQGVETLKVYNIRDYQTKEAFETALRDTIEHYRLMGIRVWVSQRPSKQWSPNSETSNK
jgi:hypothetical protein